MPIVQDWAISGDPPLQPAGREDVTSLVWTPFWQSLHWVYVQEVQVLVGLPPPPPPWLVGGLTGVVVEATGWLISGVVVGFLGLVTGSGVAAAG